MLTTQEERERLLRAFRIWSYDSAAYPEPIATVRTLGEQALLDCNTFIGLLREARPHVPADLLSRIDKEMGFGKEGE